MVQLKTLTKLDISNYVAEKCNLKKLEALKLVQAVFEEISLLLENSIDVRLSKFGNLSVKHKKERYGRNPKTLKEAVISERQVVVFKSNKTLNHLINKNIGEFCD